MKSISDLPTIPASGLWQDGPSIMARWAEEVGPVFKREFEKPVLGGVSRFVYLVGPEANRLVLHTQREAFSHEAGWSPVLGPFFGKGLLNMDGEEWRRHRQLMNPAFTHAYMAAYLPVMHRVIHERTADWVARGEVDLNEEAREIAFGVAAGALAGVHQPARVAQLRELFFALLHASFDREKETLEQFRARMAVVEQGLRDLLLPMIAERRSGLGGGPGSVLGDRPDVLQLMVSARDEQGEALSDDQLLAHLNILLVAGHETTTTMLAWLLYLLATHPEYLARVHAELDDVASPATPTSAGSDLSLEQLERLKVLGNAVTEAGRLHSPVRTGPRGIVRDVEFAGYLLPAGTHVRYSPAATHRMPSIYAAPERFDPDRFAPPREEHKQHPYALVTFGGGARTCIGVNMAQVEVRAAAAHVLHRFTLTPDPDHHPTQVGAITGFPENGVRVRVSADPAPRAAG
jgi:retinoid hydroxylase